MASAWRCVLTLIGVCAVAGLAVVEADRAPRSTIPPAASSVAEDRTRVWYRGGEHPQLVLPDNRRETIRSVLKIDYPMRFGGHVWDDQGIPQGPVWVRVDIAKQLISVFRGGHEIGSAVILYGAESKPTPAGAFTVLQKAKDYHSRTYDAPMPFMLRLTADGVAIHASNVRKGWATHGCIGVPDEFARRLFAELQLGDAVFIVP